MNPVNLAICTDVEKDYIEQKIVEYNSKQVPFSQKNDFINLDYVMKDKEGEIIGGITAVLYCWKCLYINVLWVTEKYRHQGYGAILLHQVESAAQNQGCILSHLDTFDFQAKDFYLNQGYEIFGILDDCPQDHQRFFLKKILKMLPKLKIDLLMKEDCFQLSQKFLALGWDKPLSMFEEYLAEQLSGERHIYVARLADEIIGYVTIQWESDHCFFRNNNIPEIKDINILPHFQKQSFGKSLLEFAEQQIMARSKIVGIGVGLTPDYGAAQKLYIKSGYLPTGEGITHHGQTVKHGDNVQIDDETILWFTKSLMI